MNAGHCEEHDPTRKSEVQLTFILVLTKKYKSMRDRKDEGTLK